MTEQTIDVTGLPEGWKAVAYRVPKGNIEFVFIENVVRKAKPQDKKCLIVEKIQPRRIVLEETEEDNYSSSSVGPLSSGSQLNVQSLGDGLLLFGAPKIWRVINTFSEEE